MHVHPDIAALRSDPAAQRRVQARMSSAATAWKSIAEAAAVRGDMTRYGAGADVADCPSLRALFSDHIIASDFADLWRAMFLEALHDEPLGEIPFRYRYTAGLSSVQLMQVGRATLSLLAYEERGKPGGNGPGTAMFADRQSHEIIVAGSAAGTLHRKQRGATNLLPVQTEQRRWSAGDCITLSGPDESRQIADVAGSMVLLQLSRVPERPGPSCEFRLTDGALLQTASGEKSASKRLIALAVLGEMGDGRALDVMASRALDQLEDPDVRWEAVRQALAMDARQGLALLTTLKERADDPLARPALDLETQLLAANAELARAMRKAA